MFFRSCSSIFLSSELANGKYTLSLSSFTVCYVSVFEADPDLSNEGTLFCAMSLSLSLLNGFSEYDYDTFCFYVCKLPILSWILSSVGFINGILEDMILCFKFFCLF